jgi:hypothetical protein
MKESVRSWLLRLVLNWVPCYRRTGARITFVSGDYREMRIKLPLSWKTRGYNGTLFGGSMYGAIDPIYVAMLSWHLGKDYIVWDKAATVEFRRPGRSTLYATFAVGQDSLDEIRKQLVHAAKVERSFDLALVDASGVPHVSFTKTIQVRRRDVAVRR